MAFPTKIQQLQNHCVLCSIKQMDLLRFVMELVLFDCSWCDEICDGIKYVISEKSRVTDSTNHHFSIIRIDSYDSLPILKMLNFYNVIILFKSVINKYKNHYYSNIFLRKVLHKAKSDTKYF